MLDPEVIDLEVFYDYLCPFVYRASVLLQNAGRSRQLNVTWSYFSLTQVNSRDDGWTDVERFRHDLADPDILAPLERDHLRATRGHGVFGTPTFLFPDGSVAYVRLAEAPETADAARVLERLISVAASEPSILEIKRPRKPTPD